MKTGFAGLVCIGFLAAAVSACAPADEQPAGDASSPAPAPVGAEATSPSDAPGAPAAPAAVAAGPIIVDVRTPAEYAAGHVEGAILIPHDQMEQRWQELEAFRDQPVVLYCRSGRRSGLALDVLKSKGFTQLENGGAMSSMAERGFTITTD